ncbi:hypothetical protein GCM10023156_45910 [Novipirellula rosea]|uniref:Uncharacterized protein n=1 Tax=Novipirellula rosea TaxID=1031540 RepID=A0ABP8N6M9_9BACT
MSRNNWLMKVPVASEETGRRASGQEKRQYAKSKSNREAVVLTHRWTFNSSCLLPRTLSV